MLANNPSSFQCFQIAYLSIHIQFRLEVGARGGRGKEKGGGEGGWGGTPGHISIPRGTWILAIADGSFFSKA
jgi:hypothetical protein